MYGLGRLDLKENTVSFEKTLTIAATTEINFANQLDTKPSRYIITSQKGNGLVTKGDTLWTNTKLTLKNHGASSVDITVLFMK